MEITDQRDVPHLERQEIGAEIDFSGAMPSRMEVRGELARAAGEDEELVVVRSIQPEYGKMHAKVSARIYDNEDALNKIEEDYSLARHEEEEKEEDTEEESEEGDEETEEKEEAEEDTEASEEAEDAEEGEESDEEAGDDEKKEAGGEEEASEETSEESSSEEE